MEFKSLKIVNDENKIYYIDFYLQTKSNYYNINYNNKIYNIKSEYKNANIKISLLLNYNQDFIINNYDFSNNIIFNNINKIEINNLLSIRIDKIYIINLDYRTDRKNKLESLLKKYNINNYEFIKAVDKKDINIINEYNHLINNKKTKIKTIGHYACLLSHIKVIKMINSNTIILEDDVFFDENFIEKIQKLKFTHYDMIYLGGLIDDYKIIFDNYMFNNRIMGMYAYLINIKNKNQILNILERKKYPCDIAIIKKFQKYKKILYMDLIRTNIKNSNTSKKSNEFINMFNKNINIIE